MEATKPKRKRAVRTAGIAFEVSIFNQGKERAWQRRQSFSAYVNSLIAADLGPALLAGSGCEVRAEVAK
jgi:hypothetical protein